MPNPSTCEHCGRPLDPGTQEALCRDCLAGIARASWLEPSHAAEEAVPKGAAEPPPARVRRFGDYELLEEIARGGMGIVYRALQTSLGRIVAVKMIRAGILASELDIARFQAEARAAASLRHPRIIAIHEVGEQDERHYFSMAYVEGRSMGELLREGPWPAQRAARCLHRIAEAVQHAHENGVLHRDLKPSNVIIDAAGEPHLTDFGLATRIEGASELTLSGMILGTPSYMAPEQTGRRRGKVGPATDVYALGALLYEALTGRPPFQGETALDTVELARDADPVPPRRLNPRTPRDLETICLKCLEKSPARRYPTARAFAMELERYLNGQPIEARPTPRHERAVKWARRNPWQAALAAACAAGVLALAGFLAEHQSNRLLTHANRQLQASQEPLEQAILEAKAAHASERTHRVRLEIAEATAQAALNEAQSLREAELAQRKVAEAERDRARLLHYVNSIALARQAWEANDFAETRRILSDCPPEHRGWEWHYLRRLAGADDSAITTLTAGADSRPFSLSISANGELLASAGRSGTIWLVDSSTGNSIAQATTDSRPVTAISLAAATSRIARASSNSPSGSIAIVDWRNAETIASMEDVKAPPRSITFIDEDRVLVAAGDDGLSAWSALTGKSLWRLPPPFDGAVGMAVVGTGQTIAWICGRKPSDKDDDLAATGRHTREWMGELIEIVDAATGCSMRALSSPDPVNAVAIDPGGRWLASAHDKGIVRVWDLTSGEVARVFRRGFEDVASVAFAGGSGVVLAGGGDGVVGLHRIENARDSVGDSMGELRGGRGPIRLVAYDSQRERVIYVDSAGSLRQGSLEQGQDGETLEATGFTLGFMGNDQLILSTGNAYNLQERLFKRLPGYRNAGGGRARVATQTEAGLLGLEASFGRINSDGAWEPFAPLGSESAVNYAVAINRDGAAALSARNIVGVWDGPRAPRVAQFVVVTNSGWLIFGMAFHKDSRLLAVATGSFGKNGVSDSGEPGEVGLWDWRRGTLERRLQTRRFGPWDVTFDRNSDRLASAGGLYMDGYLSRRATVPERRGEIQVWNSRTGEELFDLPGVFDNVFSIAFSPDGKRLAAAIGRYRQGEGAVKIWEMSGGHEVLTLRGFPGPAHGVAFSPDGRRLAAIGSGVLRIWSIE